MQDSSSAPHKAPGSRTAADATSAPAAPASNIQWTDLGLSPAALELIQKSGFRAPTPVQAEAIPIALEGHDLIASAQTGTGKTAGFVLPMAEKLAGRQGTYGLILAPTREIAQQTQATIDLFGTPRGVRSIVLIGGIDIRKDLEAIQSYPQIIIATPGRLCDHLDRGNIWLDYIEIVVLDEADRMLDMGFSDQLSRIMEDVPESRQTLLFSATFTPPVEALARRILYQPKRVAIGKPMSAAKTVEQSLIWMSEESKNRELRRLLRDEPGSIIVFTRSKDKATRVWRSLHSAGVYDATYIHSDRLQRDRESALAEFKEGKYRILIATDVAGRGIHVDGVAHVVNFDLPLEPEDYVHRIGRTGRAEATGRATSFITPSDRGLLKRIEKLLGHEIKATHAEDFRSREGSSNGSGDRSHSRRDGGRSTGRSGQSNGSDRPLSPSPAGTGRVIKMNAPVDASAAASGESAPQGDSSEGMSADAASSGDPAKKRRRRRRGGRGGGKGGNSAGPQSS